jgi:hypothetical protein
MSNSLVFKKRTFYAGIKIFNILPPSVTILKNDKAKFKATLRRYLRTNFFYSLDEFFVWKDDLNYCFCRTFGGILHWMCIFAYLWLFPHAAVFMTHLCILRMNVCMYVCMYVYVYIYIYIYILTELVVVTDRNRRWQKWKAVEITYTSVSI